MSGYVKLYRCIRNKGFLEDGPMLQVFMKALVDAAYKPTRRSVGRQYVDLEPGQFVFGRNKWGAELKLSPKVVRNRVERLQKWGTIKAMHKANEFTVFSFVNWDSYQEGIDDDGPTTGTGKGPTKGQPRANQGPHKEEGEKERSKSIVSPDGLTPRQPGAVSQEDSPLKPVPSNPGTKIPPCPHQGIIKLYHEVLPELPVIRVWNDDRQANLRARWKEDKKRQTLDWWRGYFEYVRRCPWLMGFVEPKDPNERTFIADLEWLVRRKNMPKVLEGKYEVR